MKKFAIVAFAAVLVFAFTVPAMAIDNIFGGYWRTRAITQQNFDGNDSGSYDLTRVDTRTRLYYTAKFSDNFKFVNKFEMDAVWGDSVYGDIGADGVSVEVKNSYADFTLSSMNFKIGVQGLGFARGFLFSDDAAAAVVTYKGDGITVPFTWIKAYEGGKGTDYNDYDVDYYAINPAISLNGVTIKPLVMYMTSKDAQEWTSTSPYADFDLWFLGADIDAKLGAAKVWFTGVYETGSADPWDGGSVDYSFSGYVVAAGASAPVGPVSAHGQFFTISGDDDGLDMDVDNFWVPKGQCYYWSEIMGNGIFDEQTPANVPKYNALSNITAINAGVSFKATPKLTLTGDLWYAKLNEDDINGENSLGTEVDLKANYKIMDNLSLDVVAAYLFVGDAIYKQMSPSAPEQENAYEVGTRLSLSF
ncbi:MAG: hypothetical protein JRC90_00050 [Deltaproteobacteria bacterium]|nr:hypothetical protein [Deltaproteobacteria bacterium]